MRSVGKWRSVTASVHLPASTLTPKNQVGNNLMLLKGYATEIFRPEQNPQFESLHCIAHLEQDIADVLPYLNTLLNGFAIAD